MSKLNFYGVVLSAAWIGLAGFSPDAQATGGRGGRSSAPASHGGASHPSSQPHVSAPRSAPRTPTYTAPKVSAPKAPTYTAPKVTPRPPTQSAPRTSPPKAPTYPAPKVTPRPSAPSTPRPSPPKAPTQSAPKVTAPKAPSNSAPKNSAPKAPTNSAPKAPPSGSHVQPPAPRPQSGAPKKPTTPVNPPRSNRTTHQDGSYTVTTGKHVTEYRADGSKKKETLGRTSVQYHSNGSHTVSKNGVAKYTQSKPEVRHDGRTYIQRTTVVKNVTVVKNYRTYSRGRYTYHAYVPVVLDPWVYSYAYTPWRARYVYTWGWHADPWYGYYGYYYHPYVEYYTPAAWLTDFFLASTLEEAYRDRLAAQQAQIDAANAAAQTPVQPLPTPAPTTVNVNVTISDDIKQQIQKQVEETIRAHERQQPVELHEVMQQPEHVYAVNDTIDATVVPACGGKTGVNCSEIPPDDAPGCTLEGGDLIRLAEQPSENAAGATMIVVTAKKDSCARNSYVMISLHDLQEFQNAFSEKVEEGLAKMKTEVAPNQK